MGTTEDDLTKQLADAFSEEMAPVQPEEKKPETPENNDGVKTPEEDKEEQKEETELQPKLPENGEEKKPDEQLPEQKQPEEKQPEAPQPLTKDDVRSIISDLRNEERSSGREVEQATNDVIEAYYPNGLSNVLVDEATGKELKTPQDVVDASGGSMDIEEATKWLMNEQFKLDKKIDEIKNDAKKIAETTVKFEKDTEVVLQKYDKLFKAYPSIQGKVFKQYINLVQKDEAKGVIISAPDMQEFYDTMLEPYRLAFEFSQNQPATNPVQQPVVEQPKPTIDDRIDENGDGSPTTEVNDPNNFAQQVKKELSTGV